VIFLLPVWGGRTPTHPELWRLPEVELDDGTLYQITDQGWKKSYFKIKKIRFFLFKSDFFDLNQIFLIFLYKQVIQGNDI